MNKKLILTLACVAATSIALARHHHGGFHHGGHYGRFHHGGYRHHGHHGYYGHHGWGWAMGAAGVAIGTAAAVRSICGPRVVYSGPVTYPAYTYPGTVTYPTVTYPAVAAPCVRVAW